MATKDTTTPASQLVTNYGCDDAIDCALRSSEAGTTISGYQIQTDRLGLRTAITETLSLSPTFEHHTNQDDHLRGRQLDRSGKRRG